MESMKKFTMSTEEKNKQMQESLEVQDSIQKCVSKVKHHNEALSQELQISHRNAQRLKAQVALIQNICTEIQEHSIPVATVLCNCVQAEESIVQYYEHFKQQARVERELCDIQKVELQNEMETWRQRVLEKKEARKKDHVLIEKKRMEMDQMIEKVTINKMTLRQKNTALEHRIRQKTAKKESVMSKMMQELQDVNEKVRMAQQKNEEVAGTKEALKSHGTELETSLQDVTTNKELQKKEFLHLQKAVDETGKRMQVFSEELEHVTARAIALELENRETDRVLESKMNLEVELTSHLGQCELELQDMKVALCELQGSCDKKQEDMKEMQDILQAKQLEQKTLISEYKLKVVEIMAEIESKKNKSLDMDSELQKNEQIASDLLSRLKEIRTTNSSMEQECEVMREDIDKTRRRAEELQVQGKETSVHEVKLGMEELRNVEIYLQELQRSLAEINKTHEEFILQVIREKSEAEAELKNTERELQSSNANFDYMVQETMILVNESRQSYAQHIEMKEAALTACKNEYHSLNKQVEKAFAEKDKVAAKMKEKLRVLEDTVRQLEKRVSQKKVDNQPQASSTPISWILPQSEQISSSDDQQIARSILKSPSAEKVVSSKQVQFQGLSSSDSNISLFDVPISSGAYMKSTSVKKRPASKCYSTSNAKKKQPPQLSNNPERISKDVQPRKFFKSRSRSIV